MKNTFTLFLYLLFAHPCTSAEAFQSRQNNSLEHAIDSILADYSGNDKPGITVGIIDQGRVVFQKGYGMADVKRQKPNGQGVVYNIASGSKQFTAYVIASLVQQQKLSLTDDIRKFIPEFPDYGRAITIEHLLYHTSGIRDYMVLMWLTGKSFEEKFDNRNAIEMIMRQNKLNFNPGDRCVYSNSNYILLAEIIHRVTGKTLDAYSASLFKTLNMNSTSFNASRTGKGIKATSYFTSGSNSVAFKDNFNAYGDGGLHTTLEDLASWDKQFYNDTSVAQQILKRGKLNNGNVLSYGMGIHFSAHRNEQVQTHSGAFLGFRSETLRFPAQKISIICLGNSEDVNPELITRSIADVYMFANKYAGHIPQPDLTTSNKSVSIKEATLYSGVYQVAPNVMIHISHEKNSLAGQVTGQPRQLLYHNTDNIFTTGVTDQVIFGSLQDGKYQQLTVVQKQGSTTARRVNVISSDDHMRYAGDYYNAEQNATYRFYSKDSNLYFNVGSNAEVKAEVLKPLNRIYFDYKNLERATIDFSVDSNGLINGFVLSSGRIDGMQFVKK